MDEPLEKNSTLTRTLARLWLHPTTIGLLVGSVAIVIVLAVLVTVRAANSKTSDLVPAEVRSKVDFPVYYPDPKKLPDGFTLNVSSFSAGDQAVVYSVRYGDGKKLVFTDQHKPSDEEIKGFLASHLPLHKDIDTSAGTAAVGAIGQQTVVSLPTRDNSWLLITAPSDINQPELTRVLQSIRRP